MKKLLLAAICCVPGLAFADDAAKPADQMAPPKPGAEQKALAPFFGGNMTWAGTMHAGAMGPNSPEMPTKGKQTCHVGLDGFWYMCEASSTTGSGKQAMKWSGHFLIGYDAGAKSYRATGVDNMGFMVTMKGELNGKKFTLVSEAPMTMMGTTFLDRVTWDLETMKFTDEHASPGGNDWKVMEEDTFKVAPGAMAKK